MNESSVFHLISDVTDKEGVFSILIGGFAVNYYKVSRQTADVDFLITKEDFEKILNLLEKAGYKNSSKFENFAHLKSSRLSLLDIDFMFVEQDTLNLIKKDSKQIKIAGQKFLVPSLNHLIALKLHAMKNNYKVRLGKDLPDIVNLVRVNQIQVKDKKFKELCLKYGNEEIYKRLLEVLE